MIPAPFMYVRPESVDEAVSALNEAGDEAILIAGGHSLLPLMRLRLASPSVLVDLDRVDGLRGVRIDAGGDAKWLSIGALTTHQQLADDPLVNEHCGVLAAVAATIGDPQVRHRGTIGGALAHGDAAGDLPAVMVALDAVFVVQGVSGHRDIPARDFFRGYLTTALEHGDVLVEVRIPRIGGWRWHHEKFRPAARAWAVVGAVVIMTTVRGDPQGASSVDEAIVDLRVGLTNMDSVPVRAVAVEDRLRGTPLARLSDSLLATAADLAPEGTNPPSDLHASADFRRHLAATLTRRGLQACRSRG